MFQPKKVSLRARIQALSCQACLNYEMLEDRRVLSANMMMPLDLGWNLINESSVFDEAGRLAVHTSSFDTDADQVADYEVTDRYTYGLEGEMTSYQRDEDLGADGVIDSKYWNQWSNHADGQLATSLEAWDHDADGILDYQARNTYSYDESGNPVSILTETDFDGDGIFDDSIESLLENQTFSSSSAHLEFDAQDRLVRSTLYDDFDGDGVTDSIGVMENVWLENGLLGSVVLEFDNDADGTFDYRSVNDYEYDSDSMLVAIHESVDEDGDGQIDYSNTYPMDWTGMPGEFHTMQLGSVVADNSPDGKSGESVDGIMASWMMRGEQNSEQFATSDRAGKSGQPVDTGLILGTALELEGDLSANQLVRGARVPDRTVETGRTAESRPDDAFDTIDNLMEQLELPGKVRMPGL